jgi:hypothetical protein
LQSFPQTAACYPRGRPHRPIAERLMIEIEHIILAAMPAEVGYVVEAVERFLR